MPILLVTGGRDFADLELARLGMRAAYTRLGCYPDRCNEITLVHGDARGADRMLADLARQAGSPWIAVPANWNLHGKAAGVLRNQEMLDRYAIDLLLAMPGGRGTADMVARAERAGVPVLDYRQT